MKLNREFQKYLVKKIWEFFVWKMFVVEFFTFRWGGEISKIDRKKLDSQFSQLGCLRDF